MQGISVATEIIEYTQSFTPLLWHTGRNAFFSDTAPSREQLELQHAATLLNKRHNTDERVAGPCLILHKLIINSQFQDNLGSGSLFQATFLPRFAEDVS